MKQQSVFVFSIALFFQLWFASPEKRIRIYLDKNDEKGLKKELSKLKRKKPDSPILPFISATKSYGKAKSFQDLVALRSTLNEADTKFAKLESKESAKLSQLGFNKEIISNLLELSDSLAFQQAQSDRKIQSLLAYNRQIGGKYQNRSKVLIYQLAYDSAMATGSYQVLENFIKLYPEAPQIDTAKSTIQYLIFKDKTKSAGPEGMERFCREYPDNPYVPLLHPAIYAHRTKTHQLITFKNFIQDYPKAKQVTDAKFWVDIAEPTQYQYKATFPMLTDKGYRYVNINGEVLHKILTDTIFEEDTWRLHYGYVYKPYKGLKQSVLSYFGDTLMTAFDADVEPLAPGYFKFLNAGIVGLGTKGDRAIFTAEYRDFKHLHDGLFVAIGLDDSARIVTGAGKEVATEGYKSIELYKNKERVKQLRNDPAASDETELLYQAGVLVFKLEDEVALYNLYDLYQDIRLDRKPNLQFKYESFEPLGSNFLVKQEGQFGVLTDEFKALIPCKYDAIVPIGLHYLATKSGKQLLLDAKGKPLSEEGYDRLQASGNFFIVKSEGFYGLLDQKGKLVIEPEFDTLQHFNGRVFIAKKAGNTLISFNGMSWIPVNYARRFEWLTNGKQRLFVLTDSTEHKTLYTLGGRMIFNKPAKRVFLLKEGYLTWSDGVKSGLLDTLGKVLLKPIYDEIIDFQGPYAQFVKDRKFGLYDFKTKKPLFKDLSDQPIKLFEAGGSIWRLSSNNASYQLKDMKGKLVLKNEFSGIKEELSQPDLVCLKTLTDSLSFYSVAERKFSLARKLKVSKRLNEGLAIASEFGSKEGIYNLKTHTWFIKPVYDEFRSIVDQNDHDALWIGLVEQNSEDAEPMMLQDVYNEKGDKIASFPVSLRPYERSTFGKL